ncbi:phage head-tail connector protein [Lysinibacillus capsici]|uniref:phage head-tail connector protein n=1 Tax=Lysinibacillus capsici TaxID=2115968 RepID=UPI0032E44226
MRLDELKLRLHIPAEDTSKDELLLILLDDAIDFIQRTCNQTFDILPPTAKKVVTQYVSCDLSGNGHVLSESIAGMSQTFESSEQRDKALTNILRKAGLIKLRFVGDR